MKRLTFLLAIFLFAAAALAQEAKKEEQYNTVREYKNRVFTLQHRDPSTIVGSIKLLGSGFQGSGISINEELNTITVRDFPENIAAIEDALKRLDVAPPKKADIELKISVLIASKTPLPNAEVPAELEPVVKQLQSTLRYAHYGLMTASVHRTKIGDGIEGSGVAEPTLLGMTASQERPIMYSYYVRRITSNSNDAAIIDIGNFQFSMRVPLDVGKGEYQYQSLGFQTPVSIRQGEKVVIGTTSMRDKALIVVLTLGVN